ncbi:MAG: Asp-tRNA(Asn)/Glu-tRNA(Gln) amidotransferase subunit GatC [Nitrospirales bacterium]|nr:Asp-tRNA(Asn)/Glu-tRNA(Gln) amidotransferase subunit GatC [Nitrospirales bacterium]
MRITEQDVRHIARLARLHLPEEEVSTMGGQLNAIIEYVEQLGSLDTADVEPTSHVLPLQNVMRDDLPRPSLSPEDALGNAPDPSDSFYRVPKIID